MNKIFFSIVKQETLPIRSFIKDYNLERPNGIICFTASVHFHAENVWFKFISHVHIVTIAFKHLDVIYLLNPEIDKLKIKTMFTNNKRFIYSPTRRFEIRGKSKRYGYYSIFIIPINNNCDTDTITEINARILN